MWKFIVLSVFLGIAQGASINDVNGNYTALMVFPTLNNGTNACVRFSLSENQSNKQGSCTDGKTVYSVNFQTFERYNGIKPQDQPVFFSLPLSVVDSSNDLEENLKATCTRDGEEIKDRAAFWAVNDNYKIAEAETSQYGRIMYLIGRQLPTAAQLEQDVAKIDVLKGKVGAVICNQEIYQEFLSGN
ncbi:hypothetical protein HF086_017382 [Spodoptera exigua]|uniref:Uncharacterized protein n=1 Tax=Spodoptera exigua TaxID=7107 RepID=A0A922S8D7_SPOEX|nr:hypothetical protein HF086_017382 [Spodoptera exigua]